MAPPLPPRRQVLSSTKNYPPSSFAIAGKVTVDHPALKDEDQEIQQIVLEEINRTDANQDGEIDRDEFVEAMKNTAKRGRDSARREHQLERKLKKSHQKNMGLSGLSILMVVVSAVAIYFAVDSGNTQVKSTIKASTESVLDSQETHVSTDVTGTPHLVDREGTDVSVQANGIIADAQSRELGGRDVVCVPIHDVARAVHGLSTSTETSLVVSDGDGNPRDILPLSGKFHDGGSELSFGDGKVFVQFDSTDCDPAMASHEDDGDVNRSGNMIEGKSDDADVTGGPFNRHLRSATKVTETQRTASRADVLKEKRELYASSLEAVRRGQRSLQDTLSVPATGSSYSTATCNSSLDQFKRNVFKVPISTVTQESVLDDSSTAQARALRWIANNDQIHPPLIPGIDDAQIIQRYILAAFYYATNGNGNSNLSTWMSSLPVCNSGDWTGVLCASDAGGSSVTGLRLSQKGLTGGGLIPELGSLSSLRTLNVGDNALAGTIPVELGGLANLQTLVVAINALTGSIPTQLGSLQVLKNLYLNNNLLSNTIPTEIGTLTGLG